MTAELEINVYGVRDTLALLRKMDSSTRWAAINKIKAAGGPLTEAAREHFPTEKPLRGWGNGKRGGRFAWDASKVRGGVQIQVGGRTPRYANAYPMVTIVQKNAAGALFDIAGLRGNSQSQAKHYGQEMFTRYLNAFHGKSWRGMWRNIRRLNEIGNEAILKACEEVASEVNRKLVQ